MLGKGHLAPNLMLEAHSKEMLANESTQLSLGASELARPGGSARGTMGGARVDWSTFCLAKTKVYLCACICRI